MAWMLCLLWTFLCLRFPNNFQWRSYLSTRIHNLMDICTLCWYAAVHRVTVCGRWRKTLSSTTDRPENCASHHIFRTTRARAFFLAWDRTVSSGSEMTLLVNMVSCRYEVNELGVQLKTVVVVAYTRSLLRFTHERANSTKSRVPSTIGIGLTSVKRITLDENSLNFAKSRELPETNNSGIASDSDGLTGTRKLLRNWIDLIG